MARLAAGLAMLSVLLAAGGCARDRDALTVALALLPSELPAYRQVLADFERESGRRVHVVAQQYADIRRALAAEAAGGSGTLDLIELDVYSLALASDQVRRLDASALEGEVAALLPEAVRAGTFDGLRFVPHRTSWQALVYDHEVLGAPPATWEELVAVARRHSGKVAFKGALYEGLTCDVLPFVWAAGGEGDRFDDAGALSAFRLFEALAPHLDPRTAVFKESTIVEAMARGELVLHLNWPFVMSLYASQGLAPERFRSAPLPRGPDGRATVLGGGYVAIPRNAPHPEEAVRLVRFLLSRATQERLGRTLGWFSARRDLPPGGPGGGDELLAGYEAMQDEIRARPERADYPRISREWQRAFRRVVLDGVAPERALREAQAAIAPGSGA